MGVPASRAHHAGYRAGADCGHAAAQAQPVRRIRRCGILHAGLIWLAAATAPLAAEQLRIATFNTELSRKGPGLLLRDLEAGDAADVAAVLRRIVVAEADVLLLQGIDYDMEGRALGRLAARLAERGLDYPHRFALRPNAGMPTGIDLDGDGRTGGPRDAQGFGYFSGQGGMAILSRLPILHGQVRDFSAMLWRDLPGALLAGAGLSPEAAAVQRLSSNGHWDVPLRRPDGGVLRLLAMHATPPVFDGPEDRNGRRNHDEIAFWRHYLDGTLPGVAPPDGAAIVLAGDFNLDPADGEGRRAAIRTLLTHPAVQDPIPASPRGRDAARRQGGVNATHRGDPALDTADWSDGPGGPGNLRVAYVLPAAGLEVVAAGLVWPEGDRSGQAGSRHGLVWVDIAF